MAKKYNGGNNNGDNTNIYIAIILLLSIIIISGIFFTFFRQPQNVVSITNEQPRQQTDQFFNIYSPPLTSSFSDISINFTQVGILKNQGTDILPLFGRRVHRSRDQWQYYALSNNGSIPGIKLTLHNAKGRDLMEENGSPELYDGDTVMVDGYDKSMTVSMYKQKPLYYI
jgi:hypothetical protein